MSSEPLVPRFAPLFDGLRVVELGQYVAAPLCGELFASGGAEVTAIEPVQGTPTRFSPPGAPDGVQYISKARGKRSVALALNTERGAAIARRLCLGADVVISNMRPGSLARLGLDYETLAADNPRIIVGEVDAFGPGPGEVSKAGVDIVAQAASGLLGSLALAAEPHVVRDVLLTDVGAGLLLAFGIAGALWSREQTGRGQHVATSLVAAGLALQVRTAHVVDGVDDELVDRVESRRAGEPFAASLRDRIAGSNRMYPTYDVFATATDWVAVGAVRHNAHVLHTIAGLDPDRDGARPTSESLRRGLAEVSAERVIEQLEAAGVPVARVRLLEEVLLDPASAESGLVDDFEHPRLGRVRLPAAPLRFSASAYRTGRVTPEVGQDTRAELRRLGFDDHEIAGLIADGVVAVPSDAIHSHAGATRE